MAKPRVQPEESPAKARGDEGARSYQALYRHYQPIGAGLPSDEVQACRADPRLVLVNVKRGVAAVLGTKEQVKAVREHLPRIAVDELVELPDLARALRIRSAERILTPGRLET